MLPPTTSTESRAPGLPVPRRTVTVGTVVVVGICLYEALAEVLNADLEEDLFPTVLSLAERIRLPTIAAVPARHAGKAGMWAALGTGAIVLQMVAWRRSSR